MVWDEKDFFLICHMNNILTDEDTIYSSFQIVTELQIFTGEENDFFLNLLYELYPYRTITDTYRITDLTDEENDFLKICPMNCILTDDENIYSSLQI